MTTSSNIESSTTSKNDLDGSTGSFNLAAETTPSPAVINATSILSQYSAVNASRDRCRRCQQLVYLTERIGPIKDLLYHKLCFKCLKCDRQLDIKTYFTNSMNLSDKEIYCQSHVPRSGKGAVSTDDVQIRSVMKAPKLDVMQRLDDRIKVCRNVSFKFRWHSSIYREPVSILNQSQLLTLSKFNWCYIKVEKKFLQIINFQLYHQ